MSSLSQAASDDVPKPRVYVVDDEETVAYTVAAILNHSGYQAWAFYTPLQALRASRTHSPDILLSDVDMPALSGTQLAMKVLREIPSCKVLLMSAHLDVSKWTNEALQEGFDFEVQHKPFSPLELLKLVAGLADSSTEPALA